MANEDQNNETNIPINTPSDQPTNPPASEIPVSPEPKPPEPDQTPPSDIPAVEPATTPQAPPSNSNADLDQEIEKIKAEIEGKQNEDTPPVNPAPQEPRSNPLANLNIGKFVVPGIIALVTIIVLGLLYYFFIYNFGTITLNVNTVPGSVKINNIGYPLEQTQTIKLRPGSYSIQIEKSDFFPYQSSFALEAGQELPLQITLEQYPAPTEIVEFTANYPNLNPSETIVSYLSNFGTTFYQADLTNFSKNQLSDNNFNHVLDVSWAPADRNVALLTSVNDETITDFQTENILYRADREKDEIIHHLFDFSKYDLVSQSLITYPPQVINPEWHPNDYEIIYHYNNPDTGENSLTKASPDLEDHTRLVDLGNMINAISKYSPDTEMIGILESGLTTTADPNPIYLFHTVSRRYEKIPTKDFYIDFIWSPDSTKILAIENDDGLAIIDTATLDSTPLDIKSESNRVAWHNSLNKLVISIQNPTSFDELITYDIDTGITSNITLSAETQFNNITDLVVSQDDSTLYFIGDSHMYSMPIR